MTMIVARTLHRRWLKDPKYRAEYEALRKEFDMIEALIEARGRAGLTQAQLAQRMNTTQATIARLESGRVLPSTRTLRKFAEATGTVLKISFQPKRMKDGRSATARKRRTS